MVIDLVLAEDVVRIQGIGKRQQQMLLQVDVLFLRDAAEQCRERQQLPRKEQVGEVCVPVVHGARVAAAIHRDFLARVERISLHPVPLSFRLPHALQVAFVRGLQEPPVARRAVPFDAEKAHRKRPADTLHHVQQAMTLAAVRAHGKSPSGIAVGRIELRVTHGAGSFLRVGRNVKERATVGTDHRPAVRPARYPVVGPQVESLPALVAGDLLHPESVHDVCIVSFRAGGAVERLDLVPDPTLQAVVGISKILRVHRFDFFLRQEPRHRVDVGANDAGPQPERLEQRGSASHERVENDRAFLRLPAAPKPSDDLPLRSVGVAQQRDQEHAEYRAKSPGPPFVHPVDRALAVALPQRH